MGSVLFYHDKFVTWVLNQSQNSCICNIFILQRNEGFHYREMIQ